MSIINVPTLEQVDEKSQEILGQIKEKLGVIPNLYATIAYSSKVLESYLGFSGAAGAGVFSQKEIEAIKLVVSQVNGCEYCLAAHTALAQMNGFSEEETLSLRAADYSDEKLNVVLLLAKDITENRGKASAAAKQYFFNQGYEENALIELVAVVNAITFTNYIFGTTEIPIDFPEAKPLELAA